MLTIINEYEEEYARLSLQAERLHDLLTAKIVEEWSGDAFNACCRESQENKEQMAELLDFFKRVQIISGSGSNYKESLPENILI